MNEVRGFVNICKPSGMTSSDVVVKVRGILRRVTGERLKVGHLGTLDPLGTGVLPIMIGKATRLFDLLTQKEKTYIASFKFGVSTDTLDSAGVVEHSGGYVPSKREIEDVLSNFVGEILQLPPKYSAKSVDGKRAYEYARQGLEVELQKKLVTIFDIKLLSDETAERLKNGFYDKGIIDCKIATEGLKNGCYDDGIFDCKNATESLKNVSDIDEITIASESVTESVNCDIITQTALYGRETRGEVAETVCDEQNSHYKASENMCYGQNLHIETSENVCDEYFFMVSCGGGTYIRSLARDMAEALGTYAHMTSICRIKSGMFDKNNSVTIDEFEKSPLEYVLSIEKALAKYPSFELPESEAKRTLNGIEFSSDELPKVDCFVVTDNGKAVGIAKNDDGKLKFTVRL